jgi:hypothetical protein
MAPKGKKQPEKNIYDYSGLETGMRVQVEYDATYYAAEVVQVSTAKSRAKAPVKVTFKGYEGYDEWIGGDRLRSKALKVKSPEQKAPEKKGVKPKEKMQLVYWPVFAKGAAPALALEMGKFDWELGAGPGSKGTGDLLAEWAEMKPETTWGFLPNLKIGGTSVGSELAILQFLAKSRRSLAGFSQEEWFVSQELLHQAEELYQKLLAKLPTIMATDKSPDEYEKFMSGSDKTTHSSAQGLLVYLQQFEDFYTNRGGKDGKFTRSGITIGEIKLWATLQAVLFVKSDVLSSYPNLSAFMKRLSETPQGKGLLEGTLKNMSTPFVQFFQAPPNSS